MTQAAMAYYKAIASFIVVYKFDYLSRLCMAQ